MLQCWSCNLANQQHGSGCSLQAASKQGRRSQSAAAHDYVQQITSRDRIIAELRARNQDLRGEQTARCLLAIWRGIRSEEFSLDLCASVGARQDFYLL